MPRLILTATFILICWGQPVVCPALERVAFQRDGKRIEITGRLVVTGADGGLMIQASDGVAWTVQPNELIKHTSDDAPFVPMPRDQLKMRLLAELPAGFEVHETANYMVFHNTSKVYAEWCGGLLERLYRAFNNYWTLRGFTLREPEFPLVAVVFASRRSYIDYCTTEIGETAKQIIGYYNLKTNRVTTYDLTVNNAIGGGAVRRGTKADLARMLARPGAEGTIATIVHEATHQIAFNCGLHARLSDCPHWFSEGIAMYFETPDLRSRKGWTSIGKINSARLRQFQNYLRRRPPGSLQTLLTDDRRLRDPKQGPDAYAEAWALTYFLIRTQPKEYTAYLKTLSEKVPFVWDVPDARLADFRAAFGGDLKTLDAEFIRYMRRLRP